MIITLFILALICLMANILITLQFKKLISPLNFGIRGSLKHYYAKKYSPETEKTVKRWIFSNWLCFLSSFSLLAGLTWSTDFNFLIALYPFFWHYAVLRFFLWQKDDQI